MSSENSRESEETVAEASEPVADGLPEPPPAPSTDSKLPRRLVFGAAAFAGAALVVAGLFGILWGVAAADDNAGRAAQREDVTRVGSVAVRAMTEVDYTKPDQLFDRSVAVSTKEMAGQINAGRDANKKVMTDAKTITTTKVMDIAVDELNTDEGKARLLAAVQVEVKQGDKSSVKPMRMEVQLTRQDENGDQAWKLSAIDSVPVVSG